MRIAMREGQVILGDVGGFYPTFRSWGLLTWDKPTQTLRGPVSLELLDRLAAICTLPSEIAAERQRLRAIREAVDAERGNEHPVPLTRYPVKAKLFDHQIRGCNMCMLTFGAVAPRKEATR